jgi:cobalt/nickel transport system permease protein
MHMADALLSPAVGGTFWVATAGVIAWCARRVKRNLDDSTIPLMGVLGAFIFAAQMVNFTIPATGSSGHLGGGLLLAILLGPCAAFLTIASVLTVQALFFADGGLLALGCNIFNMGIFPCFIAWPIYRQIAGESTTAGRIAAGAFIGAVVGLQVGALGVVLQTVLSGISAIPLRTFFYLMQSIHLAIGVVEGVVTAMVVTFIWRARPEILAANRARPRGPAPLRRLLLALATAAVLTGGVFSWFASSRPDGLEWSLLHSSGQEELPAPAQGVHPFLARLQEKTSFFPGYAVKKEEGVPATVDGRWPAADSGTTLSGLIGGVLTVLLVGAIGLALKRRGKNRDRVSRKE